MSDIKPEAQQLDFVTQLESLQRASQQLWRETTFQGFLGRFAVLLQESYGLQGFAVLSLVAQPNGKVKIDLADVDTKVVPDLGADLVARIENDLTALNLKAPDYRQGCNVAVLGGEELFFTMLGDPAAAWYMLLWRAEQPAAAETRRWRQASLDFLCKQMQGEAVWFSRLDKTQALLYRDDLTGLFNSRYLDLAIESEIRRSQRFQTAFCLLFIDLDNFKPVNDVHGHLSGSMVLKQVADVLREVLREIDSVIRYGGDEFIVLLLGSNATTGLLAAERIRRRIEKTEFRVEDGQAVRVTASIGVAAFPEHGNDRDELLKLADQTMYEGKRQGKNRVVIVGGREALLTQGLDKEII